jgi:hypothetical protein
MYDPVVSKVRRAREAFASQFGDDLRALAAHLRQTEQASGRKMVSFPPRRLNVSHTTRVR